MNRSNIFLVSACVVIILLVVYYWNNSNSVPKRPVYVSSINKSKHNAEYYNAMAFQGGSILGISYVGALQQLQTKINFDNIKKFAGSSAGAIFALLMACKIYDWESIINADHNSFLDKSVGFLDGIKNLIKNHGVYSLNKMNDWIGDLLIKHKYSADITFRELFYKTGNELFIAATNLEQKPYIKYFSRFHDPDMPCRKACIISAAIPFVFEPVRYNGHLYCDGGIVNNFPLKILIDSPQPDNTKVHTLGLKLTNYTTYKVIRMYKSKARELKITSIFDMIERLTFITFNLASGIMTSIDEEDNSIEIDALGQSASNFNISKLEKAQLIESGKKAVNNYFHA